MLAYAWRPAGLAYLLVCLAGLAIGLWPEAIVSSRHLPRTAPLPVLQTLAVCQVAYILLVYPLVLFRRSQRGSIGEWFWRAVVVETCTFMFVAVPFYVAAAYLADAVAVDVVRLVLQLLLLWPLAWVAGLWLLAPAGRTAATLLLVLIALALPAACYITLEFMPALRVGWLWDLTPATFAWRSAASRGDSWVPQPLWALLVWPVVALTAAMVRMMLPRSATSPHPVPTTTTGATDGV